MLSERKGFTLIEIVIVLAIAALIMVIVFLAIQGAQRARRDTQRRNAAGQMVAQMENFASNNNGDYPANQAAFNTQMTGAYALAGDANLDPLSDTAYRYAGAQAADPGPAGVVYTHPFQGSNRRFQICINLEQGGPACFNN